MDSNAMIRRSFFAGKHENKSSWDNACRTFWAYSPYILIILVVSTFIYHVSRWLLFDVLDVFDTKYENEQMAKLYSKSLRSRELHSRLMTRHDPLSPAWRRMKTQTPLL